MSYRYHIWSEEPPTGAQCIAGVKGYTGVRRMHPEINFAKKCLMANNFGTKIPWLTCNAFLGSKVMQGSFGVNKRTISLEMFFN